MFCRTLWKKRLLNLKAHWMNKRRRVTNKRRKNGAIHVYLLMRVTLCLTLYECYDPMDSFEISLFDEVDAFYAYGRDATMDDAYGDELAIFPHVKHEIFAIAPTLDFPIILLKSPTYIPENCALIEAQCDGLHLSYVPKDRVENYIRTLVGHEQNNLCDSYILDVVHDTTENYFERGK